MITDADALRRQMADFPDGEERRAMLEFGARGEALDAEYYLAHVEAQRQAAEKLKRQIRKEKTFAVILATPIASFFCFYLFAGFRDGRIKNFVLSGQTDYFSVVEFPYVSFSDEPYLFCILVMFYGLLAFAFGTAAAGISYFGKMPKKTHCDFNLRLSQAEAEYAREQVARGKVETLFIRPSFSPRAPPFIVAIVILILFAAIIYNVVLGHQ